MQFLIRKIYRILLPKRFREIISDFIYRDRMISLGNENPDKTFLIIRTFEKSTGLGASITIAIRNIMYADKMGYIPIIDQMSIESQYHDKIAFGKDNAWEYYFEQPTAYNLENISKSKNIVLCKNENGHKIDSFKHRNIAFEIYYFDKDINGVILEYKKYFRQYIKFSKEVEKKMYGDYENVLKGKGKILGVVGRGAEFILKKPKNHRVVPEPNVLLDKVKEIFKQEKFDHIYLATEDNDIYLLFKDEFKEKLLDNDQKRVSSMDVKKHDYLSEVPFDYGEREKYKLGLDYLSSMYLLSKCNGICGGVVSATVIAYIMSEGYEYQYFFDLGVYQ